MPLVHGFPVGNPCRPPAPLAGPKVQQLDDLMTALGLKERYARWTQRTLHAVTA